MLKMEGIQTLKGSWPWPWPWPSIGPYSISSCISHRPLPIYQISFKLKKLFVDGRTYGRTDIFPLYIIMSTLGSRPNNDITRTSLDLTGAIAVGPYLFNVFYSMLVLILCLYGSHHLRNTLVTWLSKLATELQLKALSAFTLMVRNFPSFFQLTHILMVAVNKSVATILTTDYSY